MIKLFLLNRRNNKEAGGFVTTKKKTTKIKFEITMKCVGLKQQSKEQQRLKTTKKKVGV